MDARVASVDARQISVKVLSPAGCLWIILSIPISPPNSMLKASLMIAVVSVISISVFFANIMIMLSLSMAEAQTFLRSMVPWS